MKKMLLPILIILLSISSIQASSYEIECGASSIGGSGWGVGFDDNEEDAREEALKSCRDKAVLGDLCKVNYCY